MLNSFRQKFFKSLKSKKLNVFGFFFLLSCLFLGVTKLSKTYTETIPFYVKYINVPDQYSIASNSDSIVEVHVKAYGFNLISHNFYKHFITVDFDKEAQRNLNAFAWSSKNGMAEIKSQLGTSIQTLSVEPDSLFFPYEIMTVRKVPVKLDADIAYASGYDILDSIKLSPDSVKVIGPENLVGKIQSIKTASIELTDVKSTINEQVALVIADSLKGIKLSSNRTKILGKVEKFTEGTFEVPIGIVNLPKDVKLNYFPKTVTVSYYVSLENYKNIKALDFKVVCDFNEVKDSERSYFSPELVSMPEQVKSAKMRQNKVEFIIMQ